MKSMADVPEPRRAYRQTARAAAAEANAARIVAAFRDRLETQWFDEIRLEDVAQDAGVTAQTVIRRFGGKDGLLGATVDRMAHEVMMTRSSPADDPTSAIRGVIEDYELTGDLVIRILAQEDRHPALRRVTDIGRAGHRAWLADIFAPRLAPLPPETAHRRLDALVVATDVYVWKLLRRDLRRPVEELQALMERLVQSALADYPANSLAPDGRDDRHP